MIKRIMTIVFTLAMIFNFGVSAFAAADTVNGTLADGTMISKSVSEVLLSADVAMAKHDSLKAFFNKAAADPNTVSYGAVALGGFFREITEETVSVPLSAPGTKAGDKVIVSLSDGSSATRICIEAGIVVVDFPKDADVIGYAVATVQKTDWAPVVVGNDNVSSDAESYDYYYYEGDELLHVVVVRNEDGSYTQTVSEEPDEVEDGIQMYSEKYSGTALDYKYVDGVKCYFLREDSIDNSFSWTYSFVGNDGTTKSGTYYFTDDKFEHADFIYTYPDGNTWKGTKDKNFNWVEGAGSPIPDLDGVLT